MLSWVNQNVGLMTTIVGLITIFAIFFAPIVALKIQKKIEDYKERKLRKLGIFKTMLATRANTVSLEHVKALNMIDNEFYNEKPIRDSWNIYRDHLNSYPQNQDKNSQDYVVGAQDRWEEKRVDYLTDLLYSMSEFFGYNFDKVILKKGAYSPIAHGIIDLEQQLIRRGFVEILTGNKSIKVQVVQNEEGTNT